jgi:hypothetical protein
MKKAAVVCLIWIFFLSVKAQENLLRNPGAEADETVWKNTGNSVIEKDSEGNKIFVVRHRGTFLQDVNIGGNYSGKYALLIGLGSEWAVMYRVFQIPNETVSARIFLNQAERKGVPQNGSAARFDNVGFYIFETEKEALDFARSYK